MSHLSTLTFSPAASADTVRRRMTAAIVAHGSTRSGVVPLLQQSFTGRQIVEHIDAAVMDAELELFGPPCPDARTGTLARALAQLVGSSPDLLTPAG